MTAGGAPASSEERPPVLTELASIYARLYEVDPCRVTWTESPEALRLLEGIRSLARFYHGRLSERVGHEAQRLASKGRA